MSVVSPSPIPSLGTPAGASRRAQATRARRAVRRLGSYGGTIVLLAAILLLWQLAVPERMSGALPRPWSILTTLVDIRAVLWRNTLRTGLEAVLGFSFGTLAGVLIAVGFIYSRRVARTIYPMAIVLRSLPLMALMPFLISWFGTGIASKVMLAALTCFFPTLVNVVQGLTTVDAQALEMMESLNASRRQIFWKLRVPSALPYLFTSFRITSSAAVLGAIIAEWMYANQGLGAFIVNAMFNMQGNDLWAAMMVATALSIAAYLLAVVAERLAVPWRRTITEDEANR